MSRKSKNMLNGFLNEKQRIELMEALLLGFILDIRDASTVSEVHDKIEGYAANFAARNNVQPITKSP